MPGRGSISQAQLEERRRRNAAAGKSANYVGNVSGVGSGGAVGAIGNAFGAAGQGLGWVAGGTPAAPTRGGVSSAVGKTEPFGDLNNAVGSMASEQQKAEQAAIDRANKAYASYWSYYNEPGEIEKFYGDASKRQGVYENERAAAQRQVNLAAKQRGMYNSTGALRQGAEAQNRLSDLFTRQEGDLAARANEAHRARVSDSMAGIMGLSDRERETFTRMYGTQIESKIKTEMARLDAIIQQRNLDAATREAAAARKAALNNQLLQLAGIGIGGALGGPIGAGLGNYIFGNQPGGAQPDPQVYPNGLVNPFYKPPAPQVYPNGLVNPFYKP